MGTTKGVATTKVVALRNRMRLFVDYRRYAPYISFTYHPVFLLFMDRGKLHAFFVGGRANVK